jgi:TolB-like protein
MTIWIGEIKELEKLYESFKGHLPGIVKELEQLIRTDDANVVMLYSRRCLEVIVTDLCECELRRPRKTEPLKGIIDKLNSEEKVPSHIITSMHSLNSLSTYGTHPKDFDPEQVKPVLNNLAIIIKWYLKYKDFKIISKSKEGEEKFENINYDDSAKVKSKPIKRSLLIYTSLIFILIVASVVVVLNLPGKKSGDITKLEKSIAVLPFKNDSPNDSTTYFLDGVMEEILTNLQTVKDLRVISRTSVEQYRNQTKSIHEIARELGVNYIVEGSGQKYGSSFRLRAQLIMAEHESHLWGESFQQKITEVEDIFNIQIRIAKSIANELKAVITPEERKLIEKIPAADFEVYDEYLKARSYFNNYTKESLNKALEYLNSAIEKNPDWAPLYAGLAELWIWIQQSGWEPPSVAGPKILENLNKAMELDPDLAEVHYQNAVIAQLVEWNWEKSEKEFLKALAINPNNALYRLMYAQLLLILDRDDESLEQRELAISLDPLNPATKLMYIGTLVQAGDYKTSLSLMEEALATNPEDININGMLEIVAYKCKDYDKVIRAVKYSLPITIEEDAFKGIEKIYSESGIAKAYEEIMKHLEKYAENNYIGFSEMAIRYIIANQPDKAMDWIEKGFELHDPIMTYITRSGHFFDTLFGNPRFIAICEKMSLPLPKKLIGPRL